MSLPSNLTTIILTGNYGSLDGVTLSGTISIEPNVPFLTDADANSFIVGGVSPSLDKNGVLTVTLPCNDNASLYPHGWVYKITHRLKGVTNPPPFFVRLLSTDGPTIDLTDVAQVVPTPPTYSTLYGILANANNWIATNTFADLVVSGVFTLDGVHIVAPPGGTTTYLRSDGTWHTPAGSGGGAVNSVNGQDGDVVVTATSISAVPESVVTTKGDILVASGPGSVVRLPVGSVGTTLQSDPAQADGLSWVLPTHLDQSARMFDLVGMPFPPYVVNHVDLGASPGYCIAMLIRPGRTTITNLGLWLGMEGTGPNGANGMALYNESGVKLGMTGDMSTALSSSANRNKYVEAPMLVPVNTDDGVGYYVSVLCHMSSSPQIAGFLGSWSSLPVIKGRPPGVEVSGQATFPNNFDPLTAIPSPASYWLVGS